MTQRISYFVLSLMHVLAVSVCCIFAQSKPLFRFFFRWWIKFASSAIRFWIISTSSLINSLKMDLWIVNDMAYFMAIAVRGQRGSSVWSNIRDAMLFGVNFSFSARILFALRKAERKKTVLSSTFFVIPTRIFSYWVVKNGSFMTTFRSSVRIILYCAYE